MANLRVVYDNAADRATLTASTTAGNLAAANLQNDFKSQVWRATGTSASLTAVWPNTTESMGCVALPFSDLSPTATLRVQLYSDTAHSSLVLDTGPVQCCGNASLGIWDFTQTPTGANGYSYGGGSYACAWFPPTTGVKSAIITLADAGNPLGYVEAARLVIGNYWSPATGADLGVQLSMIDTSTHARNDGGDLVTVRGSRHKALSFNLSWLTPADRTQMISILRGNGMARPLYCSMFPQNGDLDLEQAYQIYGKQTQLGAITAPAVISLFSTSLQLEEI